MESLKPHSTTTGWKSWTAKKKALIISSILALIIVIAAGLGIGLGLGLNDNNDDNDNNNNNNNNNNNPPTHPNTTTPNIWQPAVRSTWQIVLRYALNDTSNPASIYDIDLYDNPAQTIADLHSTNRRVICYFSAGTYEDWRSDASQFPRNSIGSALPDWPGESWIDTRSAAIRDIMRSRLDLAVEKGCDGVDPDNVDGYDNDNGLGLTEADAMDYVNFLAEAAHRRGLAIGLKNAGAIIDGVIANMQWSVNEQCAQYQECDVYAAFVRVGKPVFHIEYPKGDEVNDEVEVRGRRKSDACVFADSGEFSTVIKNMDLDNWVQSC